MLKMQFISVAFVTVKHIALWEAVGHSQKKGYIENGTLACFLVHTAQCPSTFFD